MFCFQPQRRRLLLGGLALALGCSRPQPLVRVAGHVWPAYELLYLARELGAYEGSGLRLVETSSATDSLMALANGEVEAAALTLDELLMALEGGLALRAILVFDESVGADVVMARPDIRTPADLEGRRIGVEDTAVGALVYAKLLEWAQLPAASLSKLPLTVDRHVEAYRSGKVDAVVTFEPHATQLALAGAIRLFDSSHFPGLIVDVLAAHVKALETSPEAFRRLLAGYFHALTYYQNDPVESARRMAPRMGITPDELLSGMWGLHLMDLAANRDWLGGASARLLGSAQEVMRVMLANRLLRQVPDLAHLADARFLPVTPT